MNRRKSITAALAFMLATFLVAPCCAAREVASVRFEDQTSLGNQALVLNGAGVRAKMIIKVYAIGLYLPRKDTAPAAILNQPGPKSIRIVMLRDVSAEKLTDSLMQGINDNISAADRLSLQSRLDALEAAMRNAGEAIKGSQIVLDYLPGIGTHVTLNGQSVVKDIAGEDFYRALLKIWLGERPSDRSLKSDLLGQP